MKVLVIGCGSIGRRHAANAAALASAAVVDSDALSARAVAAQTGALAFERLEDAFAWGPDAVVVATPHRSHLELAGRALAAGAHVLVEKPLSHAMDGVDAFLDAAAKSGRRAYVVCNMRFHPGPATLKQSLHLVGRPLFARAHVGNYLPVMRPGRDYRELYAARRAEGGGTVLDAVHEIDYLSWLFGEIEAVACHAERLSDLDIDVEDHALLALRHRSGVRASAELDYLRQRKSRGCEIIGSEGVLAWHSDGKAPERCRVRLGRPAAADWEELLNVEAVDADAPYRALMGAFLQEIDHPGSTPLLPAREAAAVLGVALAALDSAAHAGAARQSLRAGART